VKERKNLFIYSFSLVAVMTNEKITFSIIANDENDFLGFDERKESVFLPFSLFFLEIEGKQFFYKERRKKHSKMWKFHLSMQNNCIIFQKTKRRK
jgi:uncharacterized protein YfbU (UPF0304 family)